jgi:hypothetical protein
MRVIILLSLVLVAACASDPTQIAGDPVPSLSTAQVTISDGETFRLRPNEVAVTADGSLFLTFRRIDSDSRCPIDVTCVWGGNAAAVVGSAPAGGPWTWSILNTALDPRAFSTHGYSVRLIDVEPAMRADQVIRAGSYSIILQVDPI